MQSKFSSLKSSITSLSTNESKKSFFISLLLSLVVAIGTVGCGSNSVDFKKGDLVYVKDFDVQGKVTEVWYYGFGKIRCLVLYVDKQGELREIELDSENIQLLQEIKTN